MSPGYYQAARESVPEATPTETCDLRILEHRLKQRLVSKHSHAKLSLVVYSTPVCKAILILPKARIELNSLPKNRRTATGCPLTALGVVSGIELPFPTWCERRRSRCQFGRYDSRSGLPS